MFTAVHDGTKANSGTNRYTQHYVKAKKHYIILDKKELNIKHSKRTTQNGENDK